MKDPADASVVVCTHFLGIGRTVRMALRGMSVRNVALAANQEQLLEAFTVAEPHCVVLYVDGPEPTDEGLELLKFIRRDEKSPHPRVPVVVISPRRDFATISAVVNGGAHEYVLFPTSGEVLLRKITALRMAPRPWIERSDYIGPERKIDRDEAENAQAG